MKKYLFRTQYHVTLQDLEYTLLDGRKSPVGGAIGRSVATELIPPEMLAKSLDGGDLSKAISDGRVAVIGDGVASAEKPVDAIVDFMNTPRKKLEPVQVQEGANFVGETVKSQEYPQGEVKTEGSGRGATEASIPVTDVAKFNSLSHMDKLSFVKGCKDAVLLGNIKDATDSKQIKNNITRQLKTLK